jgi:hypothetical protein
VIPRTLLIFCTSVLPLGAHRRSQARSHGVHRGVLRLARSVDAGVQRGGPAFTAARVGHRPPRHGGEPADMWGPKHVVHLPRQQRRRVILFVRRHDGGRVCVRVCATAGDERPEFGGN